MVGYFGINSIYSVLRQQTSNDPQNITFIWYIKLRPNRALHLVMQTYLPYCSGRQWRRGHCHQKKRTILATMKWRGAEDIKMFYSHIPKQHLRYQCRQKKIAAFQWLQGHHLSHACKSRNTSSWHPWKRSEISNNRAIRLRSLPRTYPF